MRNHLGAPIRFLTLLGALAVSATAGVQDVSATKAGAAAAPNVTTSPVYWNWDPATVAGSSSLVRTDAGVSFTYHTSSLPPGQVVTVWIVVFNHPENCATRPCTAPADVFNPAVQGDFLYGGGHVIGGSGRGNFGGFLPVNDPSGSGLIEIGFPEMAVGLLNPLTAEIHLALHSHGPAGSGQVLKAQLSSFLGGCLTFLGPDGIADGPEDMPVAVGECSTFQYSIHQR
jgi:hypothetical protein